MVLLLILILLFFICLILTKKYCPDYLTFNFYPIWFIIFFPLIVFYCFYLYRLKKDNRYLYICIIFLIVTFYIFYYFEDYFKTLVVHLKTIKRGIKDEKFYEKFSEDCRKIMKLNVIGAKSETPCIYIANHYKENSLAFIMNGMLMEPGTKIFSVRSKYFLQNAIDKDMGCITINGFKSKKAGKDGKYSKIKELINDQIIKGYSIICYPEYNNQTYKTNKNGMSDFRSGFFRIAKELQIPIKLLAVNWRRNDSFIALPKPQLEMTIKYGKEIDITQDLEDIIEESKNRLREMLDEIM